MAGCTGSEDRLRGTPRHSRRLGQRRPARPGLTECGLCAHAPRLRSIPKVEQQAWTAEQLQAFLRAATGHRLIPALWLAATTGVRRSQLLGLKWNDVDLAAATMSVNRGIVAVGYELHRVSWRDGQRSAAHRSRPDTFSVLGAWRMWQKAERAAVGLEDNGWILCDSEAKPVHPHALSQAFERIARRAGVPVIRLHDLRHTHGTLLIKAGVPVKVVSERLGHATPAFTVDTYQHVLPGMQADAAASSNNSSLRRFYRAVVLPARTG